jgi:hypothetical protein
LSSSAQTEGRLPSDAGHQPETPSDIAGRIVVTAADSDARFPVALCRPRCRNYQDIIDVSDGFL